MIRYHLTVFIGALLICCGLAAAQEPAPAPAPAPEAPPAPPAPIDKQVQVQVWITETNESGLRNIGGNLDYKRIVRGEERESGSLQQATTNVMDLNNSFENVTLPAPDVPPFNAPLRPDMDGNLGTGVQSLGGAGLSASVISPGYGTVEGVFRAMESRSDVDLISKPELLVINGRPATIRAGTEVPYQDLKWKGVQPILSVAWKPVGVNLVLTPTIKPDDTVDLHIQEMNISDITRFDNIRGIDLPVVAERSQTGRVSLPNGQMLVIGGLSSRIIRKTERRVPVVGKVPILGIPFRARRSEAELTELIIFVRPTIVDLQNLSPTADSAMNFWRKRSSEWKNSRSISREIQVMQDGI